MNILLAAATEGEIAPTLAWLRKNTEEAPKNHFTLDQISTRVCITGVGLMATTFSLTKELLAERFDFALQAGVAGAYNQQLNLGDVVWVEEDEIAELGVEDHATLLDVFELGFLQRDSPPFTDGQLVNPLGAQLILPRARALVGALTTHTASGSAETIERRRKRYSADIETMEGAPFHYCCLNTSVPFIQLRAISNYVEPRNRENWRLGEAIESLNSSVMAWLAELAVPLPPATQ